MIATDTLLIQRKQVQSLLGVPECIDAVEHAFKLRAEGKADQPGILGIHSREGGFHIKAGILDLDQRYFVSKTNANFPENKKRNGLPTIQGIIVVSDADNGRLLALMDSTELTIIRTGAATAVAAKYLSRKNAEVALICGCGNQGQISLSTLLAVRQLKKIYAYDIDQRVAQLLAEQVNGSIEVIVVNDFRTVSKDCDIIVTCTTSKSPFLKVEHVSAGTFIAAVGSDNENKQELDPALLVSNKVVTDSTDQCASIGELHHAIKTDSMKKENVHAELGEVIIRRKQGRQSDSEIIIFDSTGTALQDVAAAAIVYQKAIGQGQTVRLNFAE
jgi:alanine dehydrogenase